MARILRLARDMRVERWMKHPVWTIKPRDTIQHAREVMEQHRVNQLPVVVDGRLVGIVTDRDLRDAFPSALEPSSAVPVATRPDHVRVENVMTANVLTVDPKTPVVDAARVMRQERVGALPVVEGGKLIGVIARSDVLDAFMALVAAQPASLAS